MLREVVQQSTARRSARRPPRSSRDSAGIWKNRFASDATISRIEPDEQELAEEREVALRHRTRYAASAKNTAAVRPPDSATSWPPLRKPAATVRIGVSISPAMNVKPNSASTPQRAVAQPRDDEQRADHHAEHQQRRHDRRRLEQRDEVELHAGERAGDRRQHRQREQPIRVAQHAVGCRPRPVADRCGGGSGARAWTSSPVRTCDPCALLYRTSSVPSGPSRRR